MTTESPTTLDQLLAAGQQHDDRFTYHIDAGWMQGRTAYGGISTALALDAALREYPGEAPLRTAQVGFVGPVGGECEVRPRLLRASKSSRFVAADVTSEQGYGTNALFTFSKARASHIDYETVPVPDIADPEALIPMPPHPARPAFTQHFDMRPARGPSIGHGLDKAEILTWVKWDVTPTCDPHVALLALADALPPAAMPLFTQFGPISSSSWICHFLTDHPTTDDGWWLILSRSNHVKRGFSTQTMYIWNRQRELVSVGGQGVAVYC